MLSKGTNIFFSGLTSIFGSVGLVHGPETVVEGKHLQMGGDSTGVTHPHTLTHPHTHTLHLHKNAKRSSS